MSITPEQIAELAIEAVRARARWCTSTCAILKAGEARGIRAVVQRLRESDVNPVINLSSGKGGDLGGADSPLLAYPAGAGEELRPEICTLDCGTMNFGTCNEYMETLRVTARTRATARDVRYRRLVMVHYLVKEGLIEDPPLIQLRMGTRYGAPDVLTKFHV